MKIENIDIQNMDNDALKRLLKEKGYKKIWQQKYDAVELGLIDECEISFDNLIEARFFGNGNEIHIFEYDSELRVVETISEDTDIDVTETEVIPDVEGIHYYNEEQLLTDRYGKKIIFRNFIGYEDDGQAYICNKIIWDYE